MSPGWGFRSSGPLGVANLLMLSIRGPKMPTPSMPQRSCHFTPGEDAITVLQKIRRFEEIPTLSTSVDTAHLV